MASTACPALVLMTGKVRELAFKTRNPVTNAPSVGFQFRFARPSGPDTATEP
jgi:hypothetical protein